MVYEIYVGNNLFKTLLSIEDTMYYIIDNGLSIVDEYEDLDNNCIKITCNQGGEHMTLLVIIILCIIGYVCLKEGV